MNTGSDKQQTLTPANLAAIWAEHVSDIVTDGPHDAACLDAFVSGGIDAVAACFEARKWVQFGIAFPDQHVFAPQVMQRLETLVTEMIAEGAVQNFFFMHKPPGLRLRFEAEDPARLQPRIAAFLEQLRIDGQISHVTTGIYEPEALLFGGQRSMTYVHRLFTLDSLNWLAYHATDEARDKSKCWVRSFVFLQALFEGLGIVGWEDLGVWAYIKTRTGRQLPLQVADDPDLQALQAEVLTSWTHGSRYGDLNGVENQQCQIATAIGHEWRRAYFEQPNALIGPRQAAAYFIIYHWNRAGLPAIEQALIANALGARRVLDDAGLDHLKDIGS